MKCEIKFDPGFADKLRQAGRQAALAALEALQGEVVSAQVMPFDQGTMQNTLTSVQPLEAGETGARLVADGPYARRLYHHPEYNFQTVNNPNAGGEWLSPWLPGGGEEGFLPDAFKAEMKRRLK